MSKHAFIFVMLIKIYLCKELYIGMFKRNDFLVAQDTLYKPKVPFSSVVAKYGRAFKCPITYLRVTDRLGVGQGMRIQIIRGGLKKNFVVLRIISAYNYPVSANIYVGCENTMTKTKVTTAKPKTTSVAPTTVEPANESADTDNTNKPKDTTVATTDGPIEDDQKDNTNQYDGDKNTNETTVNDNETTTESPE